MIEPFESALDDIPGAHPYPRTSRYHDAEVAVHRRPDGSEVRYVKRRLIPKNDDSTSPHVVAEGERPDHLGQRYFGDPGQWWRIADANPVLDPRELTDEPGKVIGVPDGLGHV
ncbi:hypothetical protein [Saccharopolyspora flava]|uniref:LysM domain-containing protein n=1 Tax=Saccharopolyspora flava TaxID=95161 RepID=A0A1I6U4W3_9PSEU|nr:hypothetical protein [Saccharopolyspora flava]SFS96500.1 hypothetical protein SAMN05660874_04593 [Saccharopolyspora flava]